MSTNIDWNQLITRAMKEQVANDQVLAAAVAESVKRRDVADKAIAPLQDAVDLEDATAGEVSLLKAWKGYRVALNRVPDQPGYPGTIDWPAPPA